MSSLDAALMHVVPAASHSQRRRGPDAYIPQESPTADAKEGDANHRDNVHPNSRRIA
jgi:hypothetical protein